MNIRKQIFRSTLVSILFTNIISFGVTISRLENTKENIVREECNEEWESIKIPYIFSKPVRYIYMKGGEELAYIANKLIE